MNVVFDIALGFILVLVAGTAVCARSAFTALCAFVTMGLVLVVAWLRLAAPDVALTEGAVGGGLTGLLFFTTYAKVRAGSSTPASTSTSRVGSLVVALVCALIAGGIFAIVFGLPEPGLSLAGPVFQNLPDLGVENPVVGVLMGFRALDTLLEVVAVFLALAGVWSLAADADWGGAPALRIESRGETLVALARFLPPFGLILGVFVVWNGSSAPGGEFPGSAILASMWLLLMIAGFWRTPSTAHFGLRVAIGIGPIVFFMIGLAGFWMTGSFLGYPPAFAKALIVAIELPLTLSLAVMLTLSIAGPPGGEKPGHQGGRLG